ncbi:MAG: hypothetical protein AB7O28_22320 [Vicinamibacterales bacterium]
MHPASATALLEGVVDYAGLFPPAALPMPAAAAEYAAALASPSAWMLGRYVTPATRLPELLDARRGVAGAHPWTVSAIVRDRSDDDVAAIADFNAAAAGLAVVDSVEARPQAPEGVDWLAERCAAIGAVYVEIAPDAEAAGWLARVKALGLRAKIRTGGVTAEAFPTPSAVAAFLAEAHRLDVPVKATAGLHHALRGTYRLTYDPASASARMYRYLNVLLAAAALDGGATPEAAEALLVEADAAALHFGEDAVGWGTAAFPVSALRQLRARRLVSFGSCSFREPVEELEPLTVR